MKLSEKQIREGRKEIQELTNFIFTEETFLIDLLSEHVNMKGAIFFESKEGEVDESIIAFYGFFFTKKKELYYYEGEEQLDEEADDYKITFEVRHYEKPEDIAKIEKEFPLLSLAREMV